MHFNDSGCHPGQKERNFNNKWVWFILLQDFSPRVWDDIFHHP